MSLFMRCDDIDRVWADAVVSEKNTGLIALERWLRRRKPGDVRLARGRGRFCRYVIRVTAPEWQGDGADVQRQLAACYRNALTLARKNGCESIAFPVIGAGTSSFDRAKALQVAMEEINRYLDEDDFGVTLVVPSLEEVELNGRLLGDVEDYLNEVTGRWYGEKVREQEPPATPPRARTLRLPRCPRVRLPKPDFAALLRRFRRRKELDVFPEPVFIPESEGDVGECTMASARRVSLEEMLDQVDESFAESLIRRIDEKGMKDAECYRRANVDRRLFNKIKNTPGYRPSKRTALAFAIALRLTLAETKDLLLKAGYALSHSEKMDIVVEYCIINGNYDLMEINQVLFKLDLQLLGY